MTDHQIRSCIMCRRSGPKRELLRFVLKEEGLVWDQDHKISGRGAYVHPTVNCWSRMRETGRWEHAYRMSKGRLAKSGNLLGQLMEQVRGQIPELKGSVDIEAKKDRKIRI